MNVLWLPSMLLSRWFGHETVEYNRDLRERFVAAIESLRASDAARTVNALQSRQELSSTVSLLHQNRHVRAMVFCGRESPFHSSADDAVQLFYPGQASLIEPFEAGSLLFEECPAAVVTSLSLFFRTLS